MKERVPENALKQVGEALLRWPVAAVLHPSATFKLAMMIGDKSLLAGYADHALSIPGLPRERDEYRRRVTEQFKIR